MTTNPQVYVPDDWVVGWVSGLEHLGPEGPFAYIVVIKSKNRRLPQGTTVTVSYDLPDAEPGKNTAWLDLNPPMYGSVVVLGKCQHFTGGWRAFWAKPYTLPFDHIPNLRLTDDEKLALKNKGLSEPGRTRKDGNEQP